LARFLDRAVAVTKPKGQPIGERFIPVVHSLFVSERYRALPPLARDILQLLMYHHDRGKNDGKVSLGCRAAANWYGVSHVTASRALKRLERDGFITAVHRGHLVPQMGRENVATAWRLNVRPFHQGNISAFHP
jgi:hypothetical protein